MVTYYFSAKGFKVKDVPVENDIIECSDDTNQAMLDYLISEHKLTEKIQESISRLLSIM